MVDRRFPKNKLQQLISSLSDNYDLTGEDIADVLWLALKQKQSLDKEAENNPDLRDDIPQDTEKPEINNNPNSISPPESNPAP